MSQGQGRAGRFIRLSLPRQYIIDLLHFSRKIPSIPVQRTMNLGKTLAARKRLANAPSWVMIVSKAYAIVCQEFPVLRQSYLALPWAHLYQHPCSLASIAIEKVVDSEPAVAFLRVGDLVENGLVILDARLRQAREDPIENLRSYRLAKHMYWFPTFLRRTLWWIGLNGSGYYRARHFGTFGVSVYASLGAESLHPLSPLTSTLNYGPIDVDGNVNMRLVYDHRVLDGATVARALARLEEVLTNECVAELEQLETAALLKSA
jgi:hypothetical protein